MPQSHSIDFAGPSVSVAYRRRPTVFLPSASVHVVRPYGSVTNSQGHCVMVSCRLNVDFHVAFCCALDQISFGHRFSIVAVCAVVYKLNPC